MTDTDMLYMSSQAKRITDLENENRELKRVLKAAVEDFRITSKQFEDGTGHCLSNGTCAECKLNGGNLADECQWIHEAEALKLIGGNDNG